MTIRVTRPVAFGASCVFVLGCLVGAALLAPITGAASYYTRSASCAGLNFYPDDGGTPYQSNGTLRTYASDTGSAVFRCNPALPTGAIVTKVAFTVVNGGITCHLTRGSWATSSPWNEFQYLAGPLTSSNGSLAQQMQTTTISYATIDNVHHDYWLECSWAGEVDYAERGIISAEVIYKITAAKG